jgi:hypothetical protein
MRVWKIFFASLLVGLLSVISAFGNDSGGEWEKVDESDGIVGYVRYTSKTNVNEIKAVGVVDAPVAVIEAVLRDDAARTEYSESCIEASRVEIPGLESTKDTYYSYHRIAMPWPMYDRDAVGKIELMIDKATGALLVQTQNISTDFKTEDQDAVRAPLLTGKWVLTPIGKNKTEALYQVLADPGGYLPSFIVNMVSQDLAINTIAGIRKMVKKDKYKNVKTIMTTTPWVR